jgi:hypothetical protein
MTQRHLANISSCSPLLKVGFVTLCPNENGEPKFAACIGELGLSALPLLPIVPTIGMPDTASIIAPSNTKATP